MTSYRYWLGILSCFLLFSLVFLGQQTGLFGSTDHEHHGETGLLLFVVPVQSPAICRAASGCLPAAGRAVCIAAVSGDPPLLADAVLFVLAGAGLRHQRGVLVRVRRDADAIRPRSVAGAATAAPAAAAIKKGALSAFFVVQELTGTGSGVLSRKLRNRCNRRCASHPGRSAARFQPVCRRFFPDRP